MSIIALNIDLDRSSTSAVKLLPYGIWQSA
jgi:hypothetical protein